MSLSRESEGLLSQLRQVLEAAERVEAESNATVARLRSDLDDALREQQARGERIRDLKEACDNHRVRAEALEADLFVAEERVTELELAMTREKARADAHDKERDEAASRMESAERRVREQDEQLREQDEELRGLRVGPDFMALDHVAVLLGYAYPNLASHEQIVADVKKLVEDRKAAERNEGWLQEDCRTLRARAEAAEKRIKNAGLCVHDNPEKACGQCYSDALSGRPTSPKSDGTRPATIQHEERLESDASALRARAEAAEAQVARYRKLMGELAQVGAIT